MSIASANITSAYTFLGIDHDGDRYVACFYYASNQQLVFYSSSDLESWTREYTTATLDYTLNLSTNIYAQTRFMFDGVSFRVLANRSGYQNGVLITVDKALTGVQQIVMTSASSLAAIYRANNLFITSINGSTSLYEPGSITSLKSFTSTNGQSSMFEYTENKYIETPASGSLVDTLHVYDKAANTVSTIALGAIVLGSSYTGNTYLADMTINPYTSEFIMEIYNSSSSAITGYFEAALPLGADPLTASNYTVREIQKEEVPSGGTRSDGLSVNGVRVGYDSTARALLLCGPGLKFLPVISIDGAYIYIKAKE